MKRPNYTIAFLCFALLAVVSALSAYNYFAQKEILFHQLKIDNEHISESIVSSVKKFKATTETINIAKLVNRISIDLDLFEFRYLDKEGKILNSFFPEEINQRVNLLAQENSLGEFFFDFRGGTECLTIFYPVNDGEKIEGYIELSMDVTDFEFLTKELRPFAIWQVKHGMTNLLLSISNAILNSLEVKETLNFTNYLSSLIHTTGNVVQISLLTQEGVVKGEALTPGFKAIRKNELGGEERKIIQNANKSIFYSVTSIPFPDRESNVLVLGLDVTSYVGHRQELLLTTLATSLITLFFILALASTIHKVNIERSKREKSLLEQTVKDRTKEIRDILDSMGQGLLTVSKDLLIQPEYSQKTEEILGLKNLSGTKIQDLLYKDRATDEVITKWFALIFNPHIRMPVTSLLKLEDREMEISGVEGTKNINVQYRPIYGNSHKEVVRVMLILTDITKEREAEREKEAESLRREMVIKILRKQDIFFAFSSDSGKLIEKAKNMLERAVKSPAEKIECLNDIFRDMHTLKGTGSAFGMQGFFFMAHRIENLLKNTIERDRELTAQLYENMSESLQELQAELDKVFEEMRELVGDDFGTGSEVVKIKKENFDRFLRKAGELDLADQVRLELFNGIVEMSRVPIGRTFHLLTDLISDTADRLGKKVAPLKLSGGDVEIVKGLDSLLKGPVVHLIRNAVDHGIETPLKRREIGKPTRGKIAFNCFKEKSFLVFQVVDDGKGIDPLVIKDIALKKEVITREESLSMTDSDILDLIFLPGFTSKSTVTLISGRGVGMDVVKVETEKFGGTVSVTSELGKGTTVTIRMPEHTLMEQSEISTLFRTIEYT